MITKRTPPIIYAPEYGIVSRVAAQNINTNALTVLQFDTTVQNAGIPFDFTNFWFTIPQAAVYGVNAFYQCAAHADVAIRLIDIYINGALAFGKAQTNLNTLGANNVSIHAQPFLNPGDTVQVRVLHQAGIVLATANVGFMSQFSIIRMSN